MAYVNGCPLTFMHSTAWIERDTRMLKSGMGFAISTVSLQASTFRYRIIVIGANIGLSLVGTLSEARI